MTTKEFIQYVSKRKELCEKMSACTTLEEAYAIAKEEGVTDDIGTFETVMTSVRQEIDLLSEDEIDKVSAAVGLSTASWIGSSAMTAVVVGGAAAAF